MTQDPDLRRIQGTLATVSGVAWALPPLVIVFAVGFEVVAWLFHAPFLAQLPLLLGYAGLLVATIVQLVLVRGAAKSFPRVDGLQLKAWLGVFGVAVLSIVVAAGAGLVVGVLIGATDRIGMNFLFLCALFVLAPVLPFVIDAAMKVGLVERKHGPGAAERMLAEQLARGVG